jgi:ABC-type multidrug transport system fused ATPase/permease subunit
MSNGGDPRLNLWAIILMSGCGMMFLAFFMPWWGITIDVPAPPTRPKDQQAMGDFQKDAKDWGKKMSDIGKHLKKYERKHKAILGESYWKEKENETKEWGQEQQVAVQKGESTSSFSSTARVWGFNFVGVALTGFIFSIVLLPVAIVPMFVKLLRNWMWIGYFVAAVVGLVMFILSLVWYFSSPGENLSSYVKQGVGWYPGPYLEILGTLATLTVGVLGGVFGLLSFLKGLKAGAAKPKSERPKQEMDFIEDDEF